MKTFEEKWTAWLDGELTGEELSQFEVSLADKSAAEKEKRNVQRLGALLKEHLGAQALNNAEFFSHQVREAIARENAGPTGSADKPAWWNIPRMAWVGATALAMFGLCTFFVMRQPAQAPSDYFTQIINTQVDPTANPYATTSVLQGKKDKVTVLWVEGLQQLPSDYAAK